MRDLIERQAAIDVCDNAIDLWHGQLGEGIVIAVKKKIEELPSAQPEIEERKEESAQNVPKEDLISRKAAIDAECEVCQIAPKKERGHNCTYYVHGCKEIECLRALPSAQPEVLACGEGELSAQPERTGRWIPCSERLPDSKEYVLVTDYGETNMGRRFCDRWWLDCCGDKLKDVTAWMPLPEPYREEENETD